MPRKILPNYIKRSGAKFASTEELMKAATVVDITQDKVPSAGAPLSRIDENRYVVSKDELHCFVIGDSGSGKTRRVILPSIHMLAKARESMIISDPKGELYRTTGEMLKKKGYSVLVLNFRNPERGNRWNPLALIEKLYRNRLENTKDKAIMMLNELTTALSETVESASDPYWARSAESVFRGIALLILEYGNPNDLTFENISIIARQLTTSFSDNRIGERKYSRFLNSLPKNSPIINNLSVIIHNAPNTRECIMSMMDSMIALYTVQEALMDLFAISDFDIDMLGKKPTALFFILPDDNDALYPIATVFVTQVYSSLIRLADSQPDGKLPTRVTFLLDEFANFAKMTAVESMLTAARSRGIRFMLVCQSMNQLFQKYGDAGAETLLSNCRTWIFMSCRNLPFLQRLQDLCGTYISPHTGEKMPLLSIDTLQQFKMGQILVLNDRCPPHIGFLNLDYSEMDFGATEKCEHGELPPKHAPLSRQVTCMEDLEQKAPIKPTEIDW